jgi:hypothetical protein
LVIAAASQGERRGIESQRSFGHIGQDRRKQAAMAEGEEGEAAAPACLALARSFIFPIPFRTAHVCMCALTQTDCRLWEEERGTISFRLVLLDWEEGEVDAEDE